MAVRYKNPSTPVPSSAASQKPEPAPLTLRKDVLVPPKPQIAAWADEVTERILKLDAWAIRLGTTFGLASDPLDMTPSMSGPILPNAEREAAPGGDLQLCSGDKTLAEAADRYGVELALATPRSSAAPAAYVTTNWQRIADTVLFGLTKGMTPVEQVTLEHRDGRWGLYYFRGPAALGPSASTTIRPSTVPLKDAPLTVRERFLQRSESFFRRYIETVEGRLAKVKESVAAGDAALAMLEKMSLK